MLPEIGETDGRMKTAAASVKAHRARQRERREVRVEVVVPVEDREALRRTAAMLRRGGLGASRARAALATLAECEPHADPLVLFGSDDTSSQFDQLLERRRDLPRRLEL
jgi:hypothetical protein